MTDDGLNEALVDRWMTENVDGYAGPCTVRKFAGGQSNPTYRVETRVKSYVLRRKPFGSLLESAHAVDREFRLMGALHPTRFPVPKPYGLCTDETVIGTMFYVMEFVDGRTFWDGTLPGMEPAERHSTYEAMIDTLARLHGVDPAAVGLADYGRPGNYFGRQIARWTKQYRASETRRIEEVERLISWLPLAVPAQERTAIVHGDFRIDNLIFAPNRPAVAAVLDWELSTLGDPLADFSYLLMNWETAVDGRAGIGGIDLAARGIPTLAEAVARYGGATGRAGMPDLNWYFAYNLFRLTAIIQGIRKRILDGTASSPQAESMAARVEPMAQQAWNFARKAGAR